MSHTKDTISLVMLRYGYTHKIRYLSNVVRVRYEKTPTLSLAGKLTVWEREVRRRFAL